MKGSVSPQVTPLATNINSLQRLLGLKVLPYSLPNPDHYINPMGLLSKQFQRRIIPSLPFFFSVTPVFLWKNKYFFHFLSECISKKDSSFPSLLLLCHTSLFMKKISILSFSVGKQYWWKIQPSLPFFFSTTPVLFYEKTSSLSFSVGMQFHRRILPSLPFFSVTPVFFYKKIVFCNFLSECNFKEGFYLPFPSSFLLHQSFLWKK